MFYFPPISSHILLPIPKVLYLGSRTRNHEVLVRIQDNFTSPIHQVHVSFFLFLDCWSSFLDSGAPEHCKNRPKCTQKITGAADSTGFEPKTSCITAKPPCRPTYTKLVNLTIVFEPLFFPVISKFRKLPGDDAPRSVEPATAAATRGISITLRVIYGTHQHLKNIVLAEKPSRRRWPGIVFVCLFV